MLTPEQWNLISKEASKLYSNLELEIIQEIAERITNVGYANTVVHNDVIIAQEMGMLYQDIIELVSLESEKTQSEIKELFENAGVETLKYDDKIYKKAGLKPIPIKQSKSMLQILSSKALKTNNNLKNLCMTTANIEQNEFIDALNNSYLEVSTGVKSYSSSIIDTINRISQKGVIVEYPSGYRTSIESAVRMNIVTGINQTCGKLQEMRADKMNWDLMELTAHGGARPEHAEWQGKIVSRSGQIGYLSLNDIGYGEVTGFKGVNCRHDWRPYYKGSSRTYIDKELNDLKNEIVIYNGKKISKYDASQIQRKMERQIRQDKKDIAGLSGILKKATDNKLIEDTKTAFSNKTLKYNTHKNELDNLIQQTQFRKDNSRLYIGSQDKSITNQISNVTKIANKYNNNVIGTKVNGIEVKEIGEHIISKTYARDVSFENVQDTLKSPIKYGKIRTDNSMQIKGENCTVVINVKTGKLITVYPKKTKRNDKK